jgi:hypothetical protein
MIPTTKAASNGMSVRGDGSFVVYDWNAWEDFLIARLVPRATVLPARINHPLVHILGSLPNNARTFLFNIDCTITRLFPTCRCELMSVLEERGILVLNRGVSDISKKTIQRRCRNLGLNHALAEPQGETSELILVKTNLNFGGENECKLSENERKILGVGETTKVIQGPYKYLVLPREDIDPSWWRDDSLILERYIGNKEDHYYRWWRFLDHMVLIEMYNPEKIKKMGDSRLLRQWQFISVDDTVAEASSGDYPKKMVRDLLHFERDFIPDFGTVDVVRDDCGEPYIIDVNKTPYYNVHLPVPGMVEHLRHALR